jgi:hypothetical protein
LEYAAEEAGNGLLVGDELKIDARSDKILINEATEKLNRGIGVLFTKYTKKCIHVMYIKSMSYPISF